MKTFQQFITEAETHDREGLGHGTGLTHRTRTGKIGSERRKSELTTQLKQHQGQKQKVRAVGGGKTVPAKPYKPRKDIGQQRKTSDRVQQPTRERGSAALSPKEAQKKAYLERKAKERGEKTKTASQLLSKKTTKTDPNYKPRKTSGYTAAERKSITRRGERVLRDIVLKSTGKKSEKELKHPISSSGYKYRKKDK